MSQPTKLESAIWYMKQGFSVFPVHPEEKRPRVRWKQYQTKPPTFEEVSQWWKRWPDSNISTATGEITDLFIIDCDTHKAILFIEEILPDSLVLPITLTPRGGRHYYFRHTEGFKNTVNVFSGTPPGIDIRTSGGQILLPPSEKNGTPYKWMDGLGIHQVQRPTLPVKLLNALMEATKKDSDNKHVRKTEPGAYGAAALAGELATLAKAIQGERNDALNRSSHALGQLVAVGELDVGQVETALMSVALSIGLSREEAAKTIKSGITSGATKPRKLKHNFQCNSRDPHHASKKKKYAKVQLIRSS